MELATDPLFDMNSAHTEGRPNQDEALNQIVSKLRDHLEQTQQLEMERLRDEHVERTKHIKRNVIIRIDRKDRSRQSSPREQIPPRSKFLSSFTQCCSSMPVLTSSMTTDTSSTTPSASSIVADDSDFLFSRSSAEQSKEKEKEILRLKSDILSDGSGSFGGDDYTTDGGSTTNYTDGGSTINYTDGGSTIHGTDTDGFTDDGSCTDASFTYSTRPVTFGAITDFPAEDDEGNLAGNDNGIGGMKNDQKSIDDEEVPMQSLATMEEEQEEDVEQEEEDDEEDNHKKVEDTEENTKMEGSQHEENQRIYIVRSEHSIVVSESQGSHAPLSQFASADEPPSFVFSDEDSQTSYMVSSASFSEDGFPLEQFEEVKPDIMSREYPFTRNAEKVPSKSLRETNISMELDTTLESTQETCEELECFDESGTDQSKNPEDVGEVLGEAPEHASASKVQFLVARTASKSSVKGRISTPSATLYKIPFIHGSFAAAAPFIMHDLKWKRILRRVMPSAHARAVTLMRETSSEEPVRIAHMMKWAENNPVVAAYGILTNNYTNVAIPEPDTPQASNGFCQAKEFAKALSPKKVVVSQGIPPLEWNVFVDPLIASELNVALEKATKSTNVNVKLRAEYDIQQHISRLVKRMVLSNGTTSQLVSEAMGINRTYTFANIAMAAGSQNEWMSAEGETEYKRRNVNADEKSINANGASSIFVTQWLSRFAAALHLGKKLQNNACSQEMKMDTENDSHTEGSDLFDDVQPTDQPLGGLYLLFGFKDEHSMHTDPSNNTFRASAKAIEALLGFPLRVVLNLKSRQVSPRVWAMLIKYIRNNNVRVESVASFDHDEIRAIGTLVTEPLKQFRLFHSAGDLQAACHAGEVQTGDSVFFNAASLVATDQDPLNAFVCGLDEFNDEVVFTEYAYSRTDIPLRDRKCKSCVDDYKKKFRLNVGCYIQPHSASANTVNAMVDFFNRHSSVYNLGFSYGGINGRVPHGLKGDGYAKQRFMGKEWDLDAKPTYSMDPLTPLDSPFIKKIVRAGAWGQLGTVNEGTAQV